MLRNIVLLTLISLAACNRSPEFKAPDGEAGLCGNTLYRFDQTRRSALVLTPPTGWQQAKTSSYWDARSEHIQGAFWVFEAPEAKAPCDESIARKANWKLVSGTLVVTPAANCASGQCQPLIELKNAAFEFSHEGQTLQFKLDDTALNTPALADSTSQAAH